MDSTLRNPPPRNRASIWSTTSSEGSTPHTDPADAISPAKATPGWDAVSAQKDARGDADGMMPDGCGDREKDGTEDGGQSTTAGAARRQRRISSAFEADSTADLWLRMVELQQRYGCYHSARMHAVASAESAADLMPSKACLDLLNDDITDDELPEEGWRILGRFVVDAAEEPGRQSNPRWKIWRRS